jgi:hypothetical protein
LKSGLAELAALLGCLVAALGQPLDGIFPLLVRHGSILPRPAVVCARVSTGSELIIGTDQIAESAC